MIPGNIQENRDITELCTLKVAPVARYFLEVSSVEELIDAIKWSKDQSLSFFILGGGSNIIFTQKIFPGLVIKMNIQSFEVLSSNQEYSIIKVGAGNNWDETVQRTVEMGISGLEYLSLIPGTVGATPVQNVGAYGQEVKNIITEVEVLDTTNLEVKNLTNQECMFRYRNSIFKTEQKGRYIITAVCFKCTLKPIQTTTYPSLQEYLDTHKISHPTVEQIRNAVIAVRNSKLPDPRVIPNVGSFFENPIIDIDLFTTLKNTYPDIKSYPMDEGKVKIYAGWLIEKAGLKGYKQGNFEIYSKNALVIINPGKGNYEELKVFKDSIITKVKELFHITLRPEPEFIVYS